MLYILNYDETKSMVKIDANGISDATFLASNQLLFGFSFAFDALTIWNAVPNDTCTCPSNDSFRWKPKAYLLSISYTL